MLSMILAVSKALACDASQLIQRDKQILSIISANYIIFIFIKSLLNIYIDKANSV